MNEQLPGIEWTHPPVSAEDPTPRRGFTLAVVSGCDHECTWTMPDGAVARCYAKDIALGVAAGAYPHGFEHVYWHPERLRAPGHLKQPSGIFMDAMSDLFSAKVPQEYIEASLKMVQDHPQHIFFVLTKNAPRLLAFRDQMPTNLWVGVSMPPSSMFGKEMNIDQQERYVHKALDVLSELKAPGRVRWMSFEPLSYRVSSTLQGWAVQHMAIDHSRRRLPIEWAVIGAASAGKTKYQPDPEWVEALLKVLDGQGVKVFYKGNLRGNPAATPWREEYPKF